MEKQRGFFYLILVFVCLFACNGVFFFGFIFKRFSLGGSTAGVRGRCRGLGGE